MRRKKRRKVRNRKRHLKKGVIIILLILLVLIILAGAGTAYYYLKYKPEKEAKKAAINYAKLVKDNYHEIIKTNGDVIIYDKKNKEIGKIKKSTVVALDGIKKDKYKIKNTNYYINYKHTEKSDKFEATRHSEYDTYKNYIPYNINVITNDNYKLYYGSDIAYEFNESSEYTIIIKLSDKYGIEFNERLFYINKEDIKEEKEASNTTAEIASKVAVLNYHYTVNREAGELNECLQTICMEDTQVEEEIKYLSDNEYYTPSMRDTYLYLTGAIRLPKKSTVITIDDGWYVYRMIPILEKYQKTGTLFLIGSLLPPEAYNSPYLELHSHTWNMHNIGDCSGAYFGGAILCWPDDKILADLKQSRDSLNGSTVFCYPFYEFNNRSIELLKQAGFEMAFAGGERSAVPGEDIFRVPRYVMFNHTTMDQFIRYISN